MVALLGPNGAGKTTTIEILEGFRLRSAGRVAVLGVDPAHGDERWRARRRRRPAVVARPRQVAGARAARAPRLATTRRYSTPTIPRPWDPDELIAAVGLTDQADQQVRRLSGGQRRRLDVAIGIVGRPELLFLDEPTAGFDPQARREFHDLVRRLADEHETTVLLTTHDLDEAETLADRILDPRRRPHRRRRHRRRTWPSRSSAEDEVRWTLAGERFAQSTHDSTAFARDLFRQHGDDVADLEVRRASLEDTYLALVHRPSGRGERPMSPMTPARRRSHAGLIELRQSFTGARARRPPALAGR